MRTDEIKKVLSKLLSLSDEFGEVEDIDEKTPPFIATLMVIARRNYPILHSIALLQDDLLSCDAILDLSRRIFEDMISIEFMVIKDKDHMAMKFLKFYYVERWINFEYLKKLGIAMDSSLEKEIIDDFENVKKDFTRSDRLANSWSMTGVEGMIDELVKEKIVSTTQMADLIQGYIQGNRKNHLSSEDAQIFSSKKRWKDNFEHSLRIGLVIAIVSYIRIASKYAQEIGNNEMVTEMDKLFNELNTSTP